jgi:serine/threonine-protein kinase HipA
MNPAHNQTLAVLIEGREAGTLREDATGRYEFSYDQEWQADDAATPLSLSMPIAERDHRDPSVRPFLRGLLPDNEDVIQRWAKEYQVSPGNPFALLRHVGEDCAGGVQFVVPDRVAAVSEGKGGVEWLDDLDVGRRLRELRRDPTAWHATATGQFSLAGAQAKIALLHDAETGRWGAPHGATPTTHILKPAVTGFDSHDLNEHLCLEAARLAGLQAASSHVASFDGERAIVVERYDRRRAPDGRIVRAHQEDVCQALSIPPSDKYQSEGGPGPEQIVDLLRRRVPVDAVAAHDIEAFVDALALNWILAGTDAHAKNYSLLLSGRQVRLAPLYDVASFLPYDGHVPKLKMAMKLGGEYRLGVIEGRHWRRLAESLGIDGDAVVGRVDDLAARLPAAMAEAAAADPVRELGSELPERLTEAVAARANDCRKALA